MISTLFRRIFREHSGAHLWVPIVVVMFLSIILDRVPEIKWTISLDWLHGKEKWLLDRSRELAGIYLAFLWVVWRSVRKATDVHWTMIGELSDALDGADRYFAIGTIPLKEWFEPDTALYLATIVEQQHRGLQQATTATPTAKLPFRHERVLLFSKDADLKAMQLSYLDQHYAKAFSAIHRRFKIPLGYLEPKEVREILKELTPDERWILARYRWYARPRRLWTTAPFRRLAKKLDSPQPFAVVSYTSDTGKKPVMLRFFKQGNGLTVETITRKCEIGACEYLDAGEHLIKLIAEKIYKRENGVCELYERFDFAKYLYP